MAGVTGGAGVIGGIGVTGRPFPDDFELFLASRSPRRSELLMSVGVPFSAVPSTGRETMVGARPEALAEGNALAKAMGAVLPQTAAAGAFVLGVDTVVVVDGVVLGKPGRREEAAEMLHRLVGRSHEVVSGVALLRGAHVRGAARAAVVPAGAGAPAVQAVAHAVTKVRFNPIDEPQLQAYLESGEWQGKAGGYAVQGLAALFVKSVAGEYSNVVGLPLGLTAQVFRQLGFDLLKRTWE